MGTRFQLFQSINVVDLQNNRGTLVPVPWRRRADKSLSRGQASARRQLSDRRSLSRLSAGGRFRLFEATSTGVAFFFGTPAVPGARACSAAMPY
jgi:hypothetical protein